MIDPININLEVEEEGAIPLQSDLAVRTTIPAIDDTLTISGAAADAKKTGDEIRDLKSAIDLGSITPEVKTALLACFENVAWINEDGQDYYDALHDALYNRYWEVTNNLTNCTTSNESVQTIKGAAYTATIMASTGYVMTGATVSVTMGGTDITNTAYSNGVISIQSVTGNLVITATAAAVEVSSISAVFTQGENTVWSDDSLDVLKTYLVVTATFEDNSTAVVPAENYTLSGSLSTASSTITVTYSGETDTFTVSVTLIGSTDYSDSFSNWYKKNATVSNGVLTLKGTQTQANNYTIYAFDRAKTLFDTVSGKTLRIRVRFGSPDWSGDPSWSSPLNYVSYELAIFKNSSITSGNDRQKRHSLYNGKLDSADKTVTSVFTADLANFESGSGTPTTSSTFGLDIYNNSANTVNVFAVEIVEVLN